MHVFFCSVANITESFLACYREAAMKQSVQFLRHYMNESNLTCVMGTKSDEHLAGYLAFLCGYTVEQSQNEICQ